MGALKGSISVRRYAVLEKLPADAPRRIVKGLRAHAFVAIDPKGDVDKSAGWVSISDAEDAELEAGKVVFGDQVRVTLRIDTLKPPAGEVRRMTAARVAELEAREDRKASRRERQELKAAVARQLRLRTLPRVRLVDVVWHLDSGVLYLWSQTKGVNELFLDLYAKSCGWRLDVDGPARWARAAGRASQRLEPTPELWAGFAGVRPLGVPTEVA